jgi:hypothetical protein
MRGGERPSLILPRPNRHDGEVDEAKAVRLLLAFWLDVLPAPRGARSPGAGEVPSTIQPCPDCRGREARWRGWRKARSLAETRGARARRDDLGLWWIACAHCGGDPVKGQGGAGVVAVDSYTGREITSARTVAAPAPKRYRRLSCLDCGGWGVLPNGKRCRTCKGVGAYSVPHWPATREERDQEEQPSDALLVAAQAGGAVVAASLWDRGSFAAVGEGLAGLLIWRRVLVWRTYVTAERVASSLPSELGAALDESFQQVVTVARGRGPIRVPVELRDWADDQRSERRQGTGRHANRFARGQRNEEIRRLAAAGWSRRRIAREFGLAKASVDGVLRLA